MDYYSNKYPISKNKHQCVGNCYKPKTWIVHPITLEHVTDIVDPFCPVRQWKYADKNGNIIKKITDKCNNNINIKEEQTPKELELNILTPTIDFSCNDFLKIYYKIYSLEDALQWIEKNNHVPYFTKKRIIDCALKSHGFSNIIDDRLINFYIDILKRKLIGKLYRRIGPYIIINKDKVYLGKSTNKGDTDDIKIIKINYIIEKFIIYKNVHKVIIEYLEYYKNEESISHTDNIIKEFLNYVHNMFIKNKDSILNKSK